MNTYVYFIILRVTHTFQQCGEIKADSEGDAFFALHKAYPQFHLEETGENPKYLCWIRSTSEFINVTH